MLAITSRTEGWSIFSEHGRPGASPCMRYFRVGETCRQRFAFFSNLYSRFSLHVVSPESAAAPREAHHTKAVRCLLQAATCRKSRARPTVSADVAAGRSIR